VSGIQIFFIIELKFAWAVPVLPENEEDKITIAEMEAAVWLFPKVFFRNSPSATK